MFINTKKFSPNFEYREELRKQWKIPLSIRVFLCAARVDPMKDHTTLLEAFTNVRNIFKDIISRRRERGQSPHGREEGPPPHGRERGQSPHLVPRQFLSSDGFLSICTINMNQGKGAWPAMVFEIPKEKRDVLCLQEYQRTSLNRNYKHNKSHPDDSTPPVITERVSIHSDKDISNVIGLDDGRACDTKRYAIIATIDGIKIANCHLCGGRNDDTKIHKGEFENKKLTLLTEIIKTNPDIIVGDFNSDLSSGLNRKEEQYWRDIYHKEGVSGKLVDFLTKKVRVWNNLPFKLLEQHEYRRVKIKGPTSKHGGSVDHIYYNPKINCVCGPINKIKIKSKKSIEFFKFLYEFL